MTNIEEMEIATLGEFIGEKKGKNYKIVKYNVDGQITPLKLQKNQLFRGKDGLWKRGKISNLDFEDVKWIFHNFEQIENHFKGNIDPAF